MSYLIMIEKHPRVRFAARFIDALNSMTVPAKSTDNNTNEQISLQDILKRWEAKPIPEPDFCTIIEDRNKRKAYDRKKLSSSSEADLQSVLRNILDRLFGLETAEGSVLVNPPELDISKDDYCMSENPDEREMKNQVKTWLDIDSALCLDFPLEMIDTPI